MKPIRFWFIENNKENNANENIWIWYNKIVKVKNKLKLNKNESLK